MPNSPSSPSTTTAGPGRWRSPCDQALGAAGRALPSRRRIGCPIADALAIDLAEGIERQNARPVLVAAGIGALEGELEVDMRDAHEIPPHRQHRRGLGNVHALLPAIAVARLHLVRKPP